MQRWLALFGVKPHLAQTFKLPADPVFIEKVRDIVGLYLNPKSQIQALNRTHPTSPMGLGYTHDYVRHGTTTLFAALDIATGEVFGLCRKRRRHEEFLSFLRLFDREVRAEVDIHVVLDNYATHKHAKVKRWLAARPQFRLHFTPTSASWLNQVNLWFGLLSQGALKRSSFRSVADLVNKIQRSSTLTMLPPRRSSGSHGAADRRQGGAYCDTYFRDSTLEARAEAPLHSIGDASRVDLVLLGRICPTCCLIARCHANASPLSVPRDVSPRASTPHVNTVCMTAHGVSW